MSVESTILNTLQAVADENAIDSQPVNQINTIIN